MSPLGTSATSRGDPAMSAQEAKAVVRLEIVAGPTLTSRPADDIDIDPFKGRTQLRPVEVTVVVDPALNVRIVRLGQILQGLVAVMVKGPPPDRPADRLQRFRTGGRHEAVRVDAPAPHRLPRSKCKPEKVERLVRKVPTPVRILAVDDLRLRRVQYQLAGREAILQRAP